MTDTSGLATFTVEQNTLGELGHFDWTLTGDGGTLRLGER